jgi:glycosyltransferase involved in cell wall biosynthesis
MNEQVSETAATVKPKVTVITGYYNRGHALDKTIDSIMNQSYTDFEFIVFNDNSSDDTKARLAKIEKKYNDSRLIIINHEENKGFVQGMIDAVNISNGEYICVQGSGDVSHKDRLLEQVNVLNTNDNVGVVGCFYTNIVEDNGLKRPRTPDSTGIDFSQLLKENYFSHGEVMFRKSNYDAVGGYRAGFIFCQDRDLWFRMIKVCDFYTVNKDLYERYVRFDGVSYSPDKFILQARYSIFASELSVIPDDSKDYEKMVINGITSMISLENSSLQNRVFKAALRAIIWGNYHLATELKNKYLINLFRKSVINFCIFLYSSKIGGLFKAITNKIFNVNIKS